MIKIGKRQKLVINNFSSVGAYLYAGTEDDSDNILLPNNEIENRDLKVGDEVEVLIYRDSEDRLIATFR
ncbi:MAG: RNA-binding protein, partial [Fusobacterium sp.]|nr:RNA-binding protein [Fusobacterium sp.]